MKRAVSAGLVSLMICGSATADVFEVRGKGLMTGKLVSENAQEMVFEGNDGQVAHYPKTDVLYYEKTENTPNAAAASGKSSAPALSMDRVKEGAKKAVAGAAGWVKGLKKSTDQVTQKLKDTAGKPLDRSAADAKGDELAKAMDEAAKAQAAMAAKVKKVNREIQRQKEEGAGHDSGSDAFKGTFGSL